MPLPHFQRDAAGSQTRNVSQVEELCSVPTKKLSNGRDGPVAQAKKSLHFGHHPSCNFCRGQSREASVVSFISSVGRRRIGGTLRRRSGVGRRRIGGHVEETERRGAEKDPLNEMKMKMASRQPRPPSENDG